MSRWICIRYPGTECTFQQGTRTGYVLFTFDFCLGIMSSSHCPSSCMHSSIHLSLSQSTPA
jgi:hypothetical protein